MSPTISAVSIATAAGFAAVFAFTFAIIQPVLGAAADMFGKARLMIVCLVLLGARQYSGRDGDLVLAAVRDPHSRRHRLRRRVSGRARADQRSRRPRETPDRDRAHAGGLHDRQSAGRFRLRPDRRFPRLARRAGRARRARHRGLDRGRRRLSRRGVDASAADQSAALRQGYRTIFTNPNAHLLLRRSSSKAAACSDCFPIIAAFLFELGETSLSIAGIVIAGFAVGGLFYTLSGSRFLPRLGVNGMMIVGRRAGRPATRRHRDRAGAGSCKRSA